MTAEGEKTPDGDEDIKIEVTSVDPEEIRNFTTEDEFMGLAVVQRQLSLPVGVNYDGRALRNR
jgi:hypothetical protein